jgi:hypothetical protein
MLAGNERRLDRARWDPGEHACPFLSPPATTTLTRDGYLLLASNTYDVGPLQIRQDISYVAPVLHFQNL